MNWQGWSDFWAMGGYGLYVWGSYAATLICVLGEIALLAMRRKSILRLLVRLPRNNFGRTRDETEA
jgi:heme exporter protein D